MVCHRSTGTARPPAGFAPALLLCVAAGCSHQDAFPTGAVPPLGPRTTNPPVQLTYDLGDDLTPSWLPDGSALVYTFTVRSVPAGNRCLGVLPSAGGTRRLEKCLRTDLLGDSIASLTWATVAPDGRAAWVDQRGLRTRLPPDRQTIRIGELMSGDTGAPVRAFPFPAPSGNLHLTATHLGWLSPTLLAYVGSVVDYPRPCSQCEADTVVTGVEAVLLDLSQSPAVVSIVPNTAGATSLWPASDGGSIYYSVSGDTRVLQQVLSTGNVSTVHDFAGLGEPGDISIRGHYMVATVRAGTGQPERLTRVDLTTGQRDLITVNTGTVERGRLSPNGRSMVVQLLDQPPPPLAPNVNLWLYEMP